MDADDEGHSASDEGVGHHEPGDGETISSNRAINGPTVDLDALRGRLESYPVRIAVLFGSVVEGNATRFSDVDIGIVFESEVDRAQRARQLVSINTAVVETVEWDDVDVVDLERSPPAIAYAAISEGTLILGDEAEATDLEASLLARKLDFQPVQREWQEALDVRLREGSYGRA